MTVIAILLLVNAAGFLLRTFDVHPYIILMGFRIHLSLSLPVLFLFNKTYRQKAKTLLKKPGRFNYNALLIIFFSGIILFAALFSTEIIKLSDPDYFYELGLSSILDFPIYLMWNLPHLIILTLFLHVISSGKKGGYLIVFIVFALLFAYRFIPLGKEKFDIIAASQLLSASLFAALVIYYIRNIYLSAFVIFLSGWIFVLLSGSKSGEIVNMFLGKYYTGWEGFFIPGKEWKDYIFFLYIGVQLILILVYILINAYNNKAVKTTAQ